MAMATLKSLQQAILADGKIDGAEVKEISKVIFADGKIDSKEANFLFALNDACSGAKNHPSWQKLFVEAICSYLLEDDVSPGEIDKKEANWLLRKIKGDGVLDSTEKSLLRRLKKESKGMPENLKSYIDENI
ncbi:MAG: hypothetical protein U0T75_04670 [Chitinophagales bacterium]